MSKIVPHFWFTTEVEEAVDFYISLFEDSKVITVQKLEGTPSGDNAISIEFVIANQKFAAINGGPYFKPNPSISFTVLCDSNEEIDHLWKEFADGGREIIPLQQQPFSAYYGWIEDRYGFSWQLIHSEGEAYDQKIIPSLMFSGNVTGQADEAIDFYVGLFQNGKRLETSLYEENQASPSKAKVSHATFELMGTALIASDNVGMTDFNFTFNEAVSLMVLCVTQAEIDYYWEKLSADPDAEECGWLKDKYGVSWQIIPHRLTELLESGTREQINTVTQAFLEMKKIDIGKLEDIWQREG